MKYFITYGDALFEDTKRRIIKEAKNANVFNSIIDYSHSDLSSELKASSLMKIRRGGGLWSWKPDVILSTMAKCDDGDIIVYADAGCTIEKSKEWQRYFNILNSSYDIIASRIFQKNEQWTRKEIIDHFNLNNSSWLTNYQFQATTIILKVSSFTRLFVKEWRDTIISHPEYVMDVPKELLSLQIINFIENRHDQAVYSALIYKYLNLPERNKIFTMWEHFEGYDVLKKQALRATRIRENQLDKTKCLKVVVKTFLKQYLIYPFVSLTHGIKDNSYNRDE